MRRFGYLIAACLLLTGSLKGAGAQDAQTSADLRCMSVMAKINQLPDSRHQLESLIGGYYYLGRIQALAPGLDLGPSTAATYAKMSPSEFLSETTRCEQEMRAKGHAITEIGSAMPKPPPSNGK
jgi:hypothetical protein